MGKLAFLPVLWVAVLAGCQALAPVGFSEAVPAANDAMQDQSAGEKTPDSLAPPNEPTPHLAAVDPRQVVYTASLEIVVANVPRAVAVAQALAGRMGGYVQRRTIQSVILRVPAGRFSQALAELERSGTVTSRDVRALDVTEDYVDLSTRLRNYRALLARLEAMLPKAGSVKEVLEIEEHLRRVRTAIERLQGQLNVLNSRITYSTITANFTRTSQAPGVLRPSLPFGWLSRLGLEELLAFGPNHSHERSLR